MTINKSELKYTVITESQKWQSLNTDTIVNKQTKGTRPICYCPRQRRNWISDVTMLKNWILWTDATHGEENDPAELQFSFLRNLGDRDAIEKRNNLLKSVGKITFLSVA